MAAAAGSRGVAPNPNQAQNRGLEMSGETGSCDGEASSKAHLSSLLPTPNHAVAKAPEPRTQGNLDRLCLYLDPVFCQCGRGFR
uniref:Uncharacterized protein n=1 Tax=Oryza brachyantha TaxID=4533 RepID=J3LSE3_ORYBR